MQHGDLWADVEWSTISNNTEFGIKVEQADDGVGELRLEDVTFDDNGDGAIHAIGVVVIEDGPSS